MSKSIAHQLIDRDFLAGQAQIAHAQVEPAHIRLENARAELAMAEEELRRADRQWRSLVAALECTVWHELGHAPLDEGQLPPVRWVEYHGERKDEDPCPILRALARKHATKSEAA